MIEDGEIQVIDEEGQEEEEEEEQEDPIIFSDSPINLNGLNVNFGRNISYGPDEKNVMDVFLPVSEEPTSLALLIHGGGFLGGDKSYFYTTQEIEEWNFPEELRELLSNNVAIANINYRILRNTDDEGIKKPLSDCKRALQYIRHVAEILNIDKDKIVLYGVSAGAGTALWLNFRDDMAESNHEDEVLRQSTRVRGSAVLETQATYDLTLWGSDIFTEYDITFEELVTLAKERVLSFYGITDLEDIYSPEIEAYRADVNLLAHMSPDDPEFWASNIIRPVCTP